MEKRKTPEGINQEKGRKRRAIMVLVIAICFICSNIYLGYTLSSAKTDLLERILYISSYVSTISLTFGGIIAVLSAIYYFIRFGTIESIEAWGMKVFLRNEPDIENIFNAYESFIQDLAHSTHIIEKVRAQMLMSADPIDSKSFIEIVLIKYLEDNDLYDSDVTYKITERESHYVHNDYTIVTLSNCTFSIEIDNITLTSDQQIILELLICKIYAIIN